MFLIEIAHPAGALSDDDRQSLAADVIAGLSGDVSDDEVPEETMRRASAMTHVGFRELTGWTTGDGPWEEGAPPLWFTLTIPEAWRDEMSRHVMGWLRRAVRQLDQSHGWERPFGALWINLVGISDGSIGLDGKPNTADDLVATMSEEFRARLDAEGVDDPEGLLLDPMCGMLVKDNRGAILLEHDGQRIGFCAESCRATYARMHDLEVPA